MFVTGYPDAGAFLQKARRTLEAREAENNLLLGIALRCERFPERVKARPYYATVDGEKGIAIAAMMTPPHKL